MLTLNTCGLSIEAALNLLEQVGPEHHELVYIDLYGNNLGDDILKGVTKLLDRYDILEFIGLGNNNLRDLSSLDCLLSIIGKKEVGADYVARHNEKTRERNLVMEKNKKLKTMKKPEEHLFYLDNLVYNEETKSNMNL